MKAKTTDWVWATFVRESSTVLSGVVRALPALVDLRGFPVNVGRASAIDSSEEDDSDI
jgi:hypothetical protein